jgi:hypothetical protein
MRLVGEGVDQEYGAQAGLRELRAADEQPPIHEIGQRTADEAHDQQWDELADAEQADHQRVVGDRRDLERDRHIGDEGPEGRDGAADEEEAEVTRGAQRREVHPQPPASRAVGHIGEPI